MVNTFEVTGSSRDWLLKVSAERTASECLLLTRAIERVEAIDAGLLKQSLMIASALLNLNLDTETVLAALLYLAHKEEYISEEEIGAEFGLSVCQLLLETVKLQSLSRLQKASNASLHYQEKIRKMLISMVTDIRTVLLILAERLVMLRDAKTKNKELQIALANETLSLYTPLANRIGVWELKWEMEDYCLRYLDPEAYTEISEWLVKKRSEREAAMQKSIADLNHLLQLHGVKRAEVQGRVKHIFSIYQKQRRKHMLLDRIYDANALRILADDIPACYTVLGLLQNAYTNIPEEFSDYIAQPKMNGYQSMHMVVRDENNQLLEIQIRTHEMHQAAELGVASHWRYKEGMHLGTADEHKIKLLRQIMAWQKELSQTSTETLPSKMDLFSDRVYVFTPQGDLIDLPIGSTPIDFAYHIHSEVGHRCRGSKVNQKIVPLTTALQTGQRVEIITAKSPQPSLDWVNPHLGYIKTARARSVVQHWFRMQGLLKEKEVTEKSLPKSVPVDQRSHRDIFFAIKQKARQVAKQITGIDSFLTKMSRCCKPLPGDAVMGYVTQTSGISIHRLDCPNLKQLTAKHRERLLEVNWTAQKGQAYAVELLVVAITSSDLLRELTGILTIEKIQIVGLTTQSLNTGETEIKLVLLVSGMDELKIAMKALKTEPRVLQVRRL